MKFKFKNLIAFTLSEMMIVLLIVSVISAATIPTITQRKQNKYNSSEVSATALWQKDNFGGIFSNLAVSDNAQTVAIGADASNTAVFTSTKKANYKSAFGNSNIALLLLNRNVKGPQITLYDKDGYTGSIMLYGNENILIQNKPNLNTYTGVNVIGIGSYAGHGSGQSRNVAIGNHASYISNSVESFNMNNDNVAIGNYSTRTGFYSEYNVGVGYCALSNACGGQIPLADLYTYYSKNIAIGAFAGHLDSAPMMLGSIPVYGNNNIALGYYAGNATYGSTTLTSITNNVRNSISIGAYSGMNDSYANNINVGFWSGGSPNPTINSGSDRLQRRNNINIGHYAGLETSIVINALGHNVSIGNYAGFLSRGNVSNSVLIGAFAGSDLMGLLDSNKNISPVVAIGYYAMHHSSLAINNNTIDNNVVTIGAYASYNSSIVPCSVYIGRYAGYESSVHDYYDVEDSNILIGHSAGANSNLTSSIAIGNYAGQSTSGTNNVFFGYAAGTFGTSHVTGSNKYIILPYTSSTVLTNTGSKFSLTDDKPQMIIGPGYGYPNGPTGFSNTTMLLYAQNIYARQTTLTSFTSDRRLKENIVPAKYGINEIRQLNTYVYNFKSDANKTKKVGLIAQEVQKVMPEAVNTGFYSKKLAINFDWILFSLANAIKQVDATLLSMKNNLKIQVKQLTSLEKRVDKLEDKTRVMLEKQDKIQAKLDDTKAILERMENK